MDATLWSDYLCPWCYVGQHRDQLLAELGVSVTHLPYELHPDIPPEGRRVRPDGRLGPTFDRVEAECETVGMPFRRPTRMPNTRRALLTAEWVRRNHPDAFAEVHRRLFAAQFVAGEPIDDPDVLDAIVRDAGAPPAEVRAAVESGAVAPFLDEARSRAHAAGVTSTPSWVFSTGWVVPGLIEEAQLRRWIGRLRERERPAPG